MSKYLDYSASSGGIDRNLKVVKVRAISIWLGHGSIAAIGSFFTGLFTANPITHWWAEIETEDPGVWYIAQFEYIGGRQSLSLTKCYSKAGVTERGQRAGNRWGDDPSMSTKESACPSRTVTMKDVYSYINGCNANYSLVSNNCQHFAGNLAHWVGTGSYYGKY